MVRGNGLHKSTRPNSQPYIVEGQTKVLTTKGYWISQATLLPRHQLGLRVTESQLEAEQVNNSQQHKHTLEKFRQLITLE